MAQGRFTPHKFAIHTITRNLEDHVEIERCHTGYNSSHQVAGHHRSLVLIRDMTELTAKSCFECAIPQAACLSTNLCTQKC